MSEAAKSETAVIDARDLICPLPVLKARKALRAVPVGGLIAIEATDPAAEGDFRAFCESAGHGLVAVEMLEGGVTRFTIARGAG